jgi:hypothetical protein
MFVLWNSLLVFCLFFALYVFIVCIFFLFFYFIFLEEREERILLYITTTI